MFKGSPKIILLFVSSIILTNQSIVSGAKLQCDYKYSAGFSGLSKTVYYCHVRDNGIFSDARAIIDSVEGIHAKDMTDDDVRGIQFDYISSMKFFPQNLHNIFSDLLLISIYTPDLQEIKQSDLKNFPNLECLHIYSTQITTIDRDLFMYNPELRGIIMSEIQIFNIHPNVFDDLVNLRELWLNDNQCKNELEKAFSREKVLKLIEQVRNGDCDSDIVEREKQLLILKNEAIQRNLTTIIDEKSRQINRLKETIDKLNDDINQYKDDYAKLQSMNQELMTVNANLTNEMSLLRGKYETLSEKLRETFLQTKQQESQMLVEKVNEWKDKYINLLDAKHTESQNLNQKLIECKDNTANMLQTKQIEVNECNNKNRMLYDKLIESEKIVRMQA